LLVKSCPTVVGTNHGPDPLAA